MNTFHKQIIIPVCAVFSLALTSFDLYGANKRKKREQSVVDLTDNEEKEPAKKQKISAKKKSRKKRKKSEPNRAPQEAKIEVEIIDVDSDEEKMLKTEPKREVIDLRDDGVGLQAGASSSSRSSSSSSVAPSSGFRTCFSFELKSSDLAESGSSASSDEKGKLFYGLDKLINFVRPSGINDKNYKKLGKILFDYKYNDNDIQAKDYYTIMGLARFTSDEKVIGAAYRKLALKWHPDKNQKRKELAETIIKLIVEANEVLADRNHRKLYDILYKEFLADNMSHPAFGQAEENSDECLEKVLEIMRKIPAWMWEHKQPLVVFALLFSAYCVPFVRSYFGASVVQPQPNDINTTDILVNDVPVQTDPVIIPAEMENVSGVVAPQPVELPVEIPAEPMPQEPFADSASLSEKVGPSRLAQVLSFIGRFVPKVSRIFPR